MKASQEKTYQPEIIEPKWQKRWEAEKLAWADDASVKPKKYILDMFPYPSGAGLHVGHVESYTATDIYARFLRMRGFNVLRPQGWDAFGLPAENYAIKTGIHPAATTKKAIATFKRQIKSMGFLYDWSREINSSDPSYYKWTQWFFLLLYKNGLAYKKKAKVNWCPKCQTVLANEQAEGGRCERCDSPVEQKDLEQWFFKITEFIEDQTYQGKEIKGLLSGLDDVDWPESTKQAQRNWIGRSYGAKIIFSLRSCGPQTDADQTQTNAEKGLLYENLTYKIRGAVFKVKKRLGLGHKENIYHQALLEEFKNLGLNFQSGKNIAVYYNNKKVGNYKPDFIIEDKIIIELKALPEIGRPQQNQIWTYLKGSKYKLALLINFGNKEVDIRRIIYDTASNFPRRSAFSPHQSATLAKVEVFTTRPDTLFGATYLVLAPEHPLLGQLKETIANYEEVEKYIAQTRKKTELERTDLAKEKTGVRLEGLAAVNPANNEEIPIFIADYVLPDYGTGAIMAVPAHDERDYDFAQKYGLPIKTVVVNNIKTSSEEEVFSLSEDRHPQRGITALSPTSKLLYQNKKALTSSDCFTGEGINVNSGFLDGLPTKQAKEKIIKWLEENGFGQRAVNYKLRDWLVSRQRYWGAPIPIIYCPQCGQVPVPEKDLPVKLPADVDFKPTGESPLKYSKKFHQVKCPKCGAPARREVDTMDTFVCSSWYYLRYADPRNDQEFASRDKIKKWLPVDLYVGGAEHTVLHLLYSRFLTKVLQKYGYLGFNEPFLKLRHQGIILAEDGNKMSKSKGNVINPDEVVAEYGADVLRLYEMFMGPLEDAKPWNTQGIVGIKRFLERVWRLGFKIGGQKSDASEKLLHKTIKKVTADIEALKFNTAISALMILVNHLEKEKEIAVDIWQKFLLILSPFAPHLSEELWQQLGQKQSIFQQSWPAYDERLVKEEEINLVLQVNGRRRAVVAAPADISEVEAKALALDNKTIKKWLAGKKVKKIIFVPGKLVNIVV